MKKDAKHRIWVKWANEFNDEYEKGDNHSRWSAESQDKFEGPGMKKLVEEALQKKVVWPWPKVSDDNGADQLKILKSNGYKEWKGKDKDAKWRLDMALECNTGKF